MQEIPVRRVLIPAAAVAVSIWLAMPRTLSIARNMRHPRGYRLGGSSGGNEGYRRTFDEMHHLRRLFNPDGEVIDPSRKLVSRLGFRSIILEEYRSEILT